MVEVLRKQSPYSFDETVKRVEESCREEDFSVMLTKNIDEMFKQKLSVQEYPRYTFILACAPNLAKMALDVSKDVGTLFPCSFVVYEDKGRVFVSHTSIMRLAVEANLASRTKMEPVLAESSRRVKAIWNRI